MQEQEEINLSTEEKGWLGKIKDSVYENWQTILVALIVLIVGISAYNYNSNTSSNPSGTAVEEKSDEQEQTDENVASEETADQEAATEEKDQESAAKQDQTNSEAAGSAATETNKENTAEAAQNTNAVAVEGESYKVTAVRGEGITHLARKALNKYLEENSDDQLTAEHKVYIEDYLQNRVGNGQIAIGHEEAFSKSQIADAIASSKTLSQKSLDNLKKYTVAR